MLMRALVFVLLGVVTSTAESSLILITPDIDVTCSLAPSSQPSPDHNSLIHAIQCEHGMTGSTDTFSSDTGASHVAIESHQLYESRQVHRLTTNVPVFIPDSPSHQLLRPPQEC